MWINGAELSACVDSAKWLLKANLVRINKVGNHRNNNKVR